MRLSETIKAANKTIESQRFLLNFIVALAGLYLTFITIFTAYQGYKVTEIRDNINTDIKQNINFYISENNKEIRLNDFKFYLKNSLYINDSSGALLKLIQRGIPLNNSEISQIITHVNKVYLEADPEPFSKSTIINNLINILAQQDQNLTVDVYFKSLVMKPLRIMSPHSSGEVDIHYFHPIKKYFLKEPKDYQFEIEQLLSYEYQYLLENQKVINQRLNRSGHYRYENLAIYISNDLNKTNINELNKEAQETLLKIFQIQPSRLSSFSDNKSLFEVITLNEILKGRSSFTLKTYKNNIYKTLNFQNSNGKKQNFSLKKNSQLELQVEKFLKVHQGKSP